MSKKETRCRSCNKLLMRDGAIKCPRCKEIVIVGNPCEYYEDCAHRLKKTRMVQVKSIKNILNTFPIAMKERLRLSSYTTQSED